MEQNEAFYIVLFCEDGNNHLQPNDDSFMAILNILGNQIKNYDRDKLHMGNILPFSENNIGKDSIINNWEGNFINLLSISDDLIFILDKDGCFLKLNEYGALLLDYNEKEILGKHFLEFIPPDENAIVAASIAKLLARRWSEPWS